MPAGRCSCAASAKISKIRLREQGGRVLRDLRLDAGVVERRVLEVALRRRSTRSGVEDPLDRSR